MKRKRQKEKAAPKPHREADITPEQRRSSPAARFLATVSAHRRQPSDFIDAGLPFARVQSHTLGLYAGGTIVTHLPRSKAHTRG